LWVIESLKGEASFLWVGGVKRAQNFSDQLRATIGLSPGTHHLTVVGVDLYDGLVKKTIIVHMP
jgi:hypothetical protein